MNYKRQVNYYLRAEFITGAIYSDNQIKAITGVNLSQLRHLWIFSSRNRFKEAVDNLIHNDMKIDFKEANKLKEEKCL
jgi:hypothetical protein